MLDPEQEKEWDKIVAKWEGPPPEASDEELDAADPSKVAEDIEARFAAPSAAPAEMRLPEMDLSEKPPVAEPAPARIREPSEMVKGPPPSAPIAKKKPSEMDWNELRRNLVLSEGMDDIGRAADQGFSNIGPGKYRADPGAYSSGVHAARLPLELAKEKQNLEAKDLAMDASRGKLAGDAAMRDPNSMQSQKAREMFKAAFPEMRLPSGFDNYSASDVQGLTKLRPREQGQLTQYQQIELNRQKELDQAKAKAAADKAAADKAGLEASRKNFAKELQAMGIDPTTAGQKDIDRAISLKHAKAQEAIAGGNYAIARSNETRRAGEHEALSEGIPFEGVGELKYTGKGTPREEDRREAQKAAALYGSAIAGMDDMEKRLNDFAARPSPETKAALASSAQITAGHLNTAYGQGAMSQDEAANMAKTLGASFDPASGIEFVIDKIVGDDPAAAHTLARRLKAARQNTRAAALAKTKAYRYELGGTGGGDMVTVFNKKTKQSKQVSRAKADAILAAPGGDAYEVR